MNQIEHVYEETKNQLIAAYRLSNSLDLMDHVLDFVEGEISCGLAIDRSRIGSLLTILKDFVKEANERLLAIENGLAEGGSAE
jgi:hypothetical protein